MSQETILFNADAEQRIKLPVTRGGKKYEVFHTLKPCEDGTYLDYEKTLKPRLRVHKDGSVERITDKQKAAEFLYAALLKQVAGWGDPAGANVDEKQRRKVIEEGFLICVVDREEEPPPVAGDAEQDKPWELPEMSTEVIKLRCRFNGEEIVTSHFPGPAPSKEQSARYESLTQRKKYRAGARMTQTDVQLQPPGKALAKLYDELFARAAGYSGRVPLWHKAEAVAALFETEEEGIGED